LLVDWYEEDESEPTFVLSPGIKETVEQGREFRADPHGHCVFYNEQDKKCDIHPVKPYECKEFMHGDSKITVKYRHTEIAAIWDNGVNQRQIRKLLGREPRAEEW